MNLQKYFAATVSAATFLALSGVAHAQSIDLRTGYYAPREAYGADPCACGAPSAQDERWAYYEQHSSSGPYGPPPQYASPQAYVGPQSYAPNAPYYPPAQAAAPGAYYPSYYDQYTPGQSTWRPETLLPPNLRGYRISGYIKGMPRPKNGYAWYHIGNDYVLASTETGAIVTIMNFPN